MEASSRPDFESQVRLSVERGDHDAAATAALRGYGAEIYAYLVSLLRAGDAADEAFSLFAEGLWRSVGSFAWQSSLRTWAYAIARRSALRQRRDAGRRARREAPMPEGSSVMAVAAEVRTTTAAHLRSEVKSRMAQLREALSPEDRELLLLRVDRALAWTELAQILRGEDAPPLEGDALKREAARLRKRFQLLKDRLHDMARREGLLGDGEP